MFSGNIFYSAGKITGKQAINNLLKQVFLYFDTNKTNFAVHS